MRHLADSASYHSSFLFRYNNIIKNLGEAKYELTEKRESVLAQVKRARDDHQIIAPKVLDWLQETETVIARAEDMETRVKNVSYCDVQFPDLKRRHRNGKEAAKATQEMKYLYKHSFQFREFTRPVTLGRVDTPKDIFYSQSAVLAYKQLLEALVDGEINAIGLHGMGGCGKSTLIKELAKEAENMRLFDKVIFVVVSKNPIIRDIQGSIASCLGLRLEEESEFGRADRLDMRFRLISGKKNLIILDDVWEKLDYEAIGIPFGPNTGCTVVITTRRQQVCTLMDCQKVISLGLLNADEAWTLFQKHANITNGNSNILSQAREISNKCQGLPIAIAAVATSLKEKTDADWEIALQKFRDHELVDFDHGVLDPYKCLQLSYDDLRDDNKAKDLFLLSSLFPEDSEIQVEDLIRSGTGLGIFKKADSYNSARREIESTINKLMRSNLLLQGKEKGSVILHGLFRDVAWEIAKNKIQLIIESGLASAEGDQMRYLHCHNKDYFQNQPNFQKFEILFVYKDDNISSRVPDSFFQRMEGLQVLNVTNRSLTPTLLLPESLKLLTELRTLCLKGCRLHEMFFLRNLEQLQTLEFCECGINELPTKIAELQKLRLLDVSRCRIGGNPFKVIGSSSNLEELYFLENQLPEIVPSDHNLAGFFDQEKGFPPKLQRYHLQIGSYIDNKKGNGDLGSKMLSISPFVASSSNATINDLVQKSQVLFLENIHAGCRNIIPDLVQTGGMNELIELLLGGSDEIECVVDASKNLSEAGPVFSKLNKLTITRMEPLVVLCRGQPPLGLFGKLKELKITKCTKLQSIGDLKLPCLKVLELEKCQMLICLFSPAIAQSWERLQVLKITNCNELKHLIAEERSEIVSEEERPSVFAQLEELSVTKCRQLEYLIPVWLATGLERLESLVIDDADSLRYVFGQSESSSFDNQNEKKPEIIQLPGLKQLKLVKLQSIISICSDDHYPSWPSLNGQYISECPNLALKTFDSTLQESIAEGSRNETITKDQKRFNTSVQGSPISKKAKMVTFATHDSESGSSTSEISTANSLCETSIQDLEMFENGSNEPTSAKAFKESKSTYETPKGLDDISDFVKNTSPRRIKGSVHSELGISATETSVTSLGETSTQDLEMLEKGLNEPISTEALQKGKRNYETSQRLGKLSDLVQKTPQSNTRTAEQIGQEPKSSSLIPAQKEHLFEEEEEEEDVVPLHKNSRLVKNGSKTGSSKNVEKTSAPGRRLETPVTSSTPLPPASPQSQAPPKTTREVQSSSIPICDKTEAHQLKNSTKADPQRVDLTSAYSENSYDNLDDEEEETPIGSKRIASTSKSSQSQTKQFSSEQQSKQQIPTEPAVDVATKTVETTTSSEEPDIDDHLAQLESIIFAFSSMSASTSVETRTKNPHKKDEVDAALKYLEDLFDKELDDIYNNEAEKSKLSETLSFLETSDETEMTASIMSLVLQLKDSYPELLDQYTSAKFVEAEFKALEKEKAEISNFTILTRSRYQQLEGEIKEAKALLQSLTGKIVEMEKSLADLSSQHQSTTHKVVTAESEKTDLQNRSREKKPRAKEVVTKLQEIGQKYVQASNKVVELRNSWNEFKSTFLSNIHRISHD